MVLIDFPVKQSALQMPVNADKKNHAVVVYGAPEINIYVYLNSNGTVERIVTIKKHKGNASWCVH